MAAESVPVAGSDELGDDDPPTDSVSAPDAESDEPTATVRAAASVAVPASVDEVAIDEDSPPDAVSAPAAVAVADPASVPAADSVPVRRIDGVPSTAALASLDETPAASEPVSVRSPSRSTMRSQRSTRRQCRRRSPTMTTSRRSTARLSAPDPVSLDEIGVEPLASAMPTSTPAYDVVPVVDTFTLPVASEDTAFE